ncbi:hypothetical protein Tco_0785859 [Tanacetum coccineum]
MSDEVLREMCDKNYHQLLPLIAEKMHKEKSKRQLNAVKCTTDLCEESELDEEAVKKSHYSNPSTKPPRTRTQRRHEIGLPTCHMECSGVGMDGSNGFCSLVAGKVEGDDE